MSFLLHVVAHVSHYVVFYTTLPYLFIHSSQLEFRNWDFFISCRNLHRKLWFKIWNSKIRYHTATLWAFSCMWWLMSHYVVFYTTLPYLFFHSSQLEFRYWDFYISCCNVHRKLWLKIWNSKIRYHMATLWAFQCMWWLMSLTTLSLTLCYLFIHSSQLEFRN